MKINLLLIFLLCFSCSEQSDAIRIGVILPVDSADGKEARQVVEDLKQSLGVEEKNIFFRVFDNKSSSYESIQRVKEISESEASMIVGPLYSTNSQAAGEAAKTHGIPLLTPSATAPEVNANNEWVFRTCFTDTMQAQAMAEFARNELGLQRVISVVKLNESYSIGLASAFEEKFVQLGGEIGKRIYFRDDIQEESNTPSELHSRVLEELIISADEFVYLPVYDTDLMEFLSAIHEKQECTTVLGGDGWDTKVFRASSILSDCNCQLFLSNHFDNKLIDDEKLKAAGFSVDGELGQIAVLMYDSLQIAIKASESGQGNRDKVRQQLAAIQIDGLSGKIDFSVNRAGNPRKPVIIQEVLSGPNGKPEFRLVSPQ